MSEKCECPRCGEIELTEFNGEYTCEHCGHLEYDLHIVKEKEDEKGS